MIKEVYENLMKMGRRDRSIVPVPASHVPLLNYQKNQNYSLNFNASTCIIID